MKSTATIYALILYFTANILVANAEFSPKSSAPIATGEHPRIFVTKTGVDALRTRITKYYKSDFQAFVKHMDGAFGSGVSYSEWNDIFCAGQSYALLYLVDPATISGVSASHSKEEYGRKALQYAAKIASGLPGDFNEQHHGPSTLSSDEGGVGSLSLQVIYDWTHDLSSLSEKKAIADRLITMWNNRYSSDKVKLENHYAANAHIYAGALCFYGDQELGSTYVSKAQDMMNSYEDVFVNRQMEVSERIFEGSSDWIEGDGYSLDGYTGLMFLAAAASSAVGEDYFAKYSWLREAPHYVYNTIFPKPYKGTYYYCQQNTSRVDDLNHHGLSSIMNMSAARLEKVDPNMASFAAWFCEESKWGHDVNEYSYYSPHLYDFFFKFMFGTKHIEPSAPEQAGVPLSKHIGQMHAMRSDYGYDDYTFVQFFEFKYFYPNGHNEMEMGAFNIHRYGPLAVSSSNTKGGPDGVPRVESGGKDFSLNNTFALGDAAYSDPDPGSLSERNADVPGDFVDGSDAHVGDVEAREYKQGWHDYINYNYTRSYKDDGSISLARRALVYLRGSVNHEYVVVLDRVNTSKSKKFILHVPVEAEAVGGSWSSASGNFKQTSAKQVSVTNKIDQSHGKMYVTSVFPEDATFYQIGGNGKEWVLGDGSPLSYRGTFGEIGAYLLSEYTVQIRSNANQFLTVMQVGDANSIGAAQQVEKLSGAGYIGAFVGKERVVIFSDSEKNIQAITYHVDGNNKAKHLITEVPKNYEYVVKKGSQVVSEGSTGKDGSISFEDNPGGSASYTVSIGGAMPSGVENDMPIGLPDEMTLSNYPNPFNPTTQIQFSLPKAGDVEISIFNARGQLVRNLVNKQFTSGEHNVMWDATDNAGNGVASGVYIYRMRAQGQAIDQKMILMR